MVVCQTPDRLRNVLPYIEECGYMEGLLGKNALVLSLTLDEIKEREEVIKRKGEEVLLPDGFNTIFGQDKKTYERKNSEEISAIRSETNKSKVYKKEA